MVPTTQPGSEEQLQARSGFPRKLPWDSAVHPVPSCSLLSEAPPVPGLQSTGGTAGNAAANAGAGL